MPENNKGKKPAILTAGTPQCALACAFLGAVVAVLFLTIGFWKTLFIALFVFAGLFLGGVADKGECVRSVTEAILPRREVKIYQAREKKRDPQAEKSGEKTDEDEDEEEDLEEEEEEDPGEEETEDEDDEDDEEEDENGDKKAGKEA